MPGQVVVQNLRVPSLFTETASHSFTLLHSFIVMKPFAVLLSVVAAAAALSVSRGPHAHDALAARMESNGSLGRRANLNKRQCRTRTNTVAPPTSTSSSAEPTTSDTPTSTQEAQPTTSSSSSEDQWWTWPTSSSSSTEQAQPTQGSGGSSGGDSSNPISYYYAGTNQGQITYYASTQISSPAFLGRV